MVVAPFFGMATIPAIPRFPGACRPLPGQSQIKHTKKGGFVYAAFGNCTLKDFVSVEPELFGGEHAYLDLSSIHVSEDMRDKGIGTALFLAAKDCQ